MEIYLGLDLGTTSIKVALIDSSGAIRSFVSVPNPIQRQNNRVRQDAFHLFHTATQAIDRCIEASQIPINQISCMSVSSQRESFAFLDATGISPIYCWQDPTKPAHLQLTSHHKIATVDTLFFYFLSDKKRFITDPTQQSFALFDDSPALKAEVIPSKGNFGHYRGIPICASLADQPASLYACNQKTVLGLGTGAFLLTLLEPEILKEYKGKKYQAATAENLYTEWCIPTMAPIFNTLVDQYTPHRTFLELESLAASTLSAKGFFHHPQIGSMKGFSPLTGVAEWLHAIYEGYVFSLKELVDQMQKSQNTLHSTIPIVGGCSHLNFLAQQLSDLTGIRFIRPKCVETALLGALKLATDNPLTPLLEADTIFSPQPNQALHDTYQQWKEIFYGV